jgi:hypothetical protein
VEDGDLPCAVCHEEEIVGLVESCHFHVGVCFKVHRANETISVLVARLVHRGEQVEEGILGGMEGHGAFVSMKCYSCGWLRLQQQREGMWWK